MLNMEEIENTIETLQNGDTTFINCEKLASLYIVRDYYSNALNRLIGGQNGVEKTTEEDVRKEFTDILPHYDQYVRIKLQYQLGELSSQQVLNVLGKLCTEIREFIHTLYNSTDMPEERTLLKEMISQLP